MKKAILTLFALAVGSAMTAQTLAPFKAGDRVTFVGNSITDGGHYHSYIWLYYMTRFPSRQMWMANCGIGGDTAEDILRRFDGDVAAKNPTVVTLTFGMNDTGYWEYNGDDAQRFADSKVAEARRNFLEIEKKLKKLTGTRVVMVGTSPYDQTSTFNDNIYRRKNDAMQRVIAIQDSAARANHWEFIDFNAPMCDVGARMQRDDPDFSVCGNDRVHPDNDGHMLMAYLFLKAQGMTGRPVADFCINARQKKAEKAENCTITAITASRDVLAFDYLSEALPYPLDTIPHGWGFTRPQSDIVKMIPDFADEMNSERLTVSGLKGSYRLLIDDILIDTLAATDLERGVNLTAYRHTPQYQQACAVMSLNEERWDIERRIRDFVWLQYGWFLKEHGITDYATEEAARTYREGSKTNAWVSSRKDIYSRLMHPEIMKLLEQEQDLIVRTIYAINNPVTRHFRLEKVKD